MVGAVEDKKFRSEELKGISYEFNLWLGELFKGHEDFLDWSRTNHHALLAIDHIYDGDDHDPSMECEALMRMMTEWAFNPFWKKHAEVMSVIMQCSIVRWQLGNISNCRMMQFEIYSDIIVSAHLLIFGKVMTQGDSVILWSFINKLLTANDKEEYA